jgi:ABC-type transport system substrate-binding protein
MRRFAGYWGSKTGATNLDILYVPTPSTQVSDLEAGKVNLMFPTQAGAASLKGVKGVHVAQVSSAVTVFLDINNLRAPFNNVDVRRAVALAVNRSALATVAYQGAATASGYVPPTYSWSAPVTSLPYSTQNVAEAKALLAAGGYPHGLTTSLIYIPNYDPGTNALVELLASQLGSVGIHVTLNPLPTAAWVQANNTDQNYTLSWNEQSYYSNPLEYVNVPGYRQGPVPPALATLFHSANSSTTTSALYADINAIQKEEASLVYPTITLLALKIDVAYSSNLANVSVGPSLSRNFLASVEVR